MHRLIPLALTLLDAALSVAVPAVLLAVLAHYEVSVQRHETREGHKGAGYGPDRRLTRVHIHLQRRKRT